MDEASVSSDHSKRFSVTSNRTQETELCSHLSAHHYKGISCIPQRGFYVSNLNWWLVFDFSAGIRADLLLHETAIKNDIVATKKLISLNVDLNSKSHVIHHEFDSYSFGFDLSIFYRWNGPQFIGQSSITTLKLCPSWLMPNVISRLPTRWIIKKSN